DQFRDLQSLIRQIKESWDGPVILGGPMVTLAPLHTAAHCSGADVLFRGEVEHTLIDFLHLYFASDPWGFRSLTQMLGIPGLCVRYPGGTILSSFDQVPEVETGRICNYGTGFLNENDLRYGLEFSTSRGCPRSCTFCSHVHGKHLRVASPEQIDHDLCTAAISLRKIGARSEYPHLFSININDDDILINPQRAAFILDICRKHGFKLWGIQTSIESLRDPGVRADLFQRLSEPSGFVDDRVVLWIGTDAFSKVRLHRLGKQGSESDIERICEDIHSFGFFGYHYWIITDAESTWEELMGELQLMLRAKSNYPESFHILPNAATLVPYPGTPVYRQRLQQKVYPQIILQALLTIPGCPELDYPLVSHERPRDSYLYALVEPRADVAERLLTDPWRFINHIRAGRFGDAIMDALAILTLKIRDMENGCRRNELETLKRCIMERWFS
ncbi:MAG TPA: hypothetical protein PLV45_15080, partial [bacterium]|nr:hypothetical protein [bacterium]